MGKVLRQNRSNARRNRSGQPSSESWGGERSAVVICQLALLATARTLQRDLQPYDETATTNTVVASALPEATMVIRRYREYWRYGMVRA